MHCFTYIIRYGCEKLKNLLSGSKKPKLIAANSGCSY
jgi:hypothetical protein